MSQTEFISALLFAAILSVIIAKLFSELALA
jgi:hypothetical protein